MSLDGHIRLALLPSYGPGTAVIRLLPDFRRLYPRIRLSISLLTLSETYADLAADRLSFALVDRPAVGDQIGTTLCGVSEYVAVASRAYCNAHTSFDQAAQVLLGDLIDLGPDLPSFAAWIGAGNDTLANILTVVQPALIVPNYHAAADLVALGAGIAVLPRDLVAPSLASGHLVAVGASHPTPSRPLHLVFRHRSARPLVEAVFMEYLLDHLGGAKAAAEPLAGAS
jgi:DNA-binding transcriptional LysR family regulator